MGQMDEEDFKMLNRVREGLIDVEEATAKLHRRMHRAANHFRERGIIDEDQRVSLLGGGTPKPDPQGAD